MELVELINDLSVDINEIVGTYIDRENYITCLPTIFSRQTSTPRYRIFICTIL